MLDHFITSQDVEKRTLSQDRMQQGGAIVMSEIITGRIH
jgi:hypothetical protein